MKNVLSAQEMADMMLHTMTEHDLPISRKMAIAVVESYHEKILSALSDGRTVRINGSIGLSVGIRPSRKGRNPATGEEMEIPEGRYIKAQLLTKGRERFSNKSTA